MLRKVRLLLLVLGHMMIIILSIYDKIVFRGFHRYYIDELSIWLMEPGGKGPLMMTKYKETD